MKHSNNLLEQIYSVSQLWELSKFVVSENYEHHSDGLLSPNYEKEIDSIYCEEKQYFDNSTVYIAKEISGNIIGSIRTLEWNYKDMLPIQKIFDINPMQYGNNVQFPKIWHIGRFAIAKDVNDINLFKRLMICAIHPVCQYNNSFVFAECDSKLLRVLKLMGIVAEVIGQPVEYLGSETIPVCMTTNGLLKFYEDHKNLVPDEIFTQTACYIEPF